jgi:hypothetical protein
MPMPAHAVRSTPKKRLETTSNTQNGKSSHRSSVPYPANSTAMELQPLVDESPTVRKLKAMLPDHLKSGTENLPTAKISQPRSSKDSVRGRLCFAYAALAALETTGIVPNIEVEGKTLKQEDFEDFLVGKNQFSSGGGASTAFRQLGRSPTEVVTYNTDSEGNTTTPTRNAGDARNLIQNAMANNLPLTAGLRWNTFTKKGKKSGNHWVYVTGKSGNNLYIRDQQNNHLAGIVDMESWEGVSVDKTFTYTITKVATSSPRQIQNNKHDIR